MCFQAISRMLGMQPKIPAMPAPPRPLAPPPEPVDDMGSAAERLRARAARGRAATLLTGGQGVTESAPLARPAAGAGRTLLG